MSNSRPQQTRKGLNPEKNHRSANVGSLKPASAYKQEKLSEPVKRKGKTRWP